MTQWHFAEQRLDHVNDETTVSKNFARESRQLAGVFVREFFQNVLDARLTDANGEPVAPHVRISLSDKASGLSPDDLKKLHAGLHGHLTAAGHEPALWNDDRAAVLVLEEFGTSGLIGYPRVRPEWHFENRQVDLVAEGYDLAIGGGFDLVPGVVSRALAPDHIIAVASRDHMIARTPPPDPSGLAEFDGIVMRSTRSGRVRQWIMRDAAGDEMPAALPETIIVNDPAAMREATLLGLGVALLAVPDEVIKVAEELVEPVHGR